MGKDLALSLLWLRLDLWLRNFHMTWVQPKKKRGGTLLRTLGRAGEARGQKPSLKNADEPFVLFP